MSGYDILREPAARFDFRDKVTGSARYCADLFPDGMLFARTLRSQRPRAWLRSVHVPPLPEWYTVIDYRDIPHKNVVPIVMEDQPFFAEKTVNYIGEPILLIAGPDREVLKAIIEQIRVEYEDRTPVLTLEEAMTRTSDYLFENKPWFVEYEYGEGDMEAAARQAVRCVEEEFRTGYQEHAYIEPQSMIAAVEDGIITICGSMQCPYYIKEALAQALGWSEERIRVIQLPTGGGFGGKEEFPSIPAVHAALAAIKTGKPVQLVYDRQEDILCSTKRHPALIRIKSHLDASNRILAREIDIAADAGAYAGLSSVVLQRMIYSAFGVYRLDNIRVRGRAYATNKAASGAFRGFGGPQVFFAIEMHMEHIARQLSIDPLMFKQTYFLSQGDPTATGGQLRSPVQLDELTDAVCRLSGYAQKRHGPRESSGKLRGIGISVFFHGCGFTGAGERDLISACVRLRKGADGTVRVFASSAEIGQGAMTALGKIAAQTLDIPLSRVNYDYPDTALCPDSGPTSASRTVMVVGRLVQEAARRLKERWNEAECEEEAHYVYPEGFFWDKDRHKGDAYPEYSWGACAVEVMVDPVTCTYEITGSWAAFDAGTVIDVRIAAGQVQGGMAQGLGYGAMEVLEYQNGRPLQCSLTDYAIPTCLDLPPVTFRMLQGESTLGPFGARGLGELTLVGAAPALAAAVENAIGKPVRKLPVTPEYILELMQHE